MTQWTCVKSRWKISEVFHVGGCSFVLFRPVQRKLPSVLAHQCDAFDIYAYLKIMRGLFIHVFLNLIFFMRSVLGEGVLAYKA